MKEVDTMTNTNSSKTTQRSALQYAIDNLPDAPVEIVEKWHAMIAQIDKKNSAERKPTTKQMENAGFKSDILAYLEPDTLYTAADVAKIVPSVVAAGLSVQRVSAMLSQLVTAGSLVRTEDKRKNFYSLA
jgi:DNA-binding transcriptional regulator PaaX